MADQPSKKRGFFSRKEKGDAISESQLQVVPSTESSSKEQPEEPPESANVPQSQVIQPVSFVSLFRFSTRTELTFNVIGVIAAAAAGAAQASPTCPLMSLLFGNLVQAFVTFGSTVQESKAGTLTDPGALTAAENHFRMTAAKDASYLVYIGLRMFMCTYVYMLVWVYTEEVNAKRIRERYLKAILRQDIAFFNHVGAGEVATRIQTDTHLVQQGISEKVAICVSFFASFVTRFVLAYVRSWRLALALSSMLPCIAVTGGVMNKFVSRYMKLSLAYVADSGTLAEEVFSMVRTAQAFGTQEVLSDRVVAVMYEIYSLCYENARKF
ncbi:hypothetical protein SCP_0702280 [Sparassis crispa]|uniref:ABC transmembrane type-1 domain-containing protein n=1 Tax=Sparassis crispa TaxID=139825 RepID=A0A401GS29_9APHY|nr:hypothetical protein SCP_0702280 [Sparassis crispa]GBE85042.1 hypothetical protein SCP_0702280 [Sparassis crispa]